MTPLSMATKHDKPSRLAMRRRAAWLGAATLAAVSAAILNYVNPF
jgi:hypothetical protein